MNRDKLCICGKTENLKHVYYCDLLNSTNIIYSYDKIYNGTTKEQYNILTRMKLNLTTRERIICNNKAGYNL